MLALSLANLLAKYSCSAWNKCRPLRVICRYGYRCLSSIATVLATQQFHTVPVDTYPWPYSNPRFADWPEEASTLITDPANFVIRHPTSYCAWKLRELTGKWPTTKITPKDPVHAQEIATRERPRDARYWLEFLGTQGYTETTANPLDTHHYIGIDPSCGEYGLVVWFEHNDPGSAYRLNPTRYQYAWVTTYLFHKFHHERVPINKYTWVKIGPKNLAP